MTEIIKKRILLSATCLTKNIEEHILDKIKSLTENECTKEYGYILSIKRIIEYENIEDTVFSVKFEAETLKPETGKHLKGKVCMIFKDGIFIDIQNKQKMLIPAYSLTSYNFDPVCKTYTCGSKKIKVGDELQATVSAVKYTDQKFSCFGTIQ